MEHNPNKDPAPQGLIEAPRRHKVIPVRTAKAYQPGRPLEQATRNRVYEFGEANLRSFSFSDN